MTAQDMFNLVYEGDYERRGNYLSRSANGSVLYAPRSSVPAVVHIREDRLLSMESSMWPHSTPEATPVFDN